MLIAVMHLWGYVTYFILSWVAMTMRGGHVAFRVNARIGPYSGLKIGLTHMVALSPLVFYLVSVSMAIIMNDGNANGIVKGVSLKDSGYSARGTLYEQ